MSERSISKKISSTLKAKLSHLSWFSPMALIIIAVLASAVVAFALVRSSIGNGQAEEKKVELIKISSAGMTPTQITRTAGVCVLTIDNQSGIKEITLHLDRADGERMREIVIPSGVPNWGAEVDLATGNYTLKEATHPQWSCQIIVQ